MLTSSSHSPIKSAVNVACNLHIQLHACRIPYFHAIRICDLRDQWELTCKYVQEQRSNEVQKNQCKVVITRIPVTTQSHHQTLNISTMERSSLIHRHSNDFLPNSKYGFLWLYITNSNRLIFSLTF